MCGIAGYFSSTNLFVAKHVERMTACLAHRGPDNTSTFVEGPVGLGHRRLSIIDLSNNANQPMTSANERYVMVYNGEVYNYKEIAAELKIPLKTNSDSEVVLEAFVKWGPNFVERLNGMFSIAIYDKKEHQLNLWRDRIGIKPLYYYFDGNNFAFASELKALLELPVEKTVHQEAVKDYLFLEYIPEPHTIFQHFFKLEKGHALKVNEKGIEKYTYYDLLHQLKHSSKQRSEKSYLEEFDGLLSSAVKKRMISDVPIGAFLSGGNDSSTICAKFQEISTDPIHTFTIGFTEKEYDESAHAAFVSKHLKTNHHLSIIKPSESLSRVSNIPDHYDEPFAVSSTIPMMLVSEVASKHVKVALSGDGGDELFMGYGYYRWNDRIKKISNIGGTTGRKMASLLLHQLDNRSKRAARIFNYEDIHRIWLHTWSQEQYMFSEKEIGQLFGHSYQHETTYQDWKKISDLSIPDYDKIALFDLRHYLANNLLHKVDIATMSQGLEARVPFLDHEMVEFAINLPNQFKINGTVQKYLLKKWLEQKLPKEAVYRKKWGFPAPINHWLKNELHHLFKQYLSKEAIHKTGLFDHKVIDKMVGEFNAGHDYHYKRLWALIYYQMWHEKYMA